VGIGEANQAILNARVMSCEQMSEGDTAAKTSEHKPEPSRLPASVVGWQAMDTKRLWNDCTQLLVAVPVQSRIRNSRMRAVDDWFYEFSVVVIRCDEDFFDIETTDGDAWGWDLDSVDFYVILSE
jgi:hypothetical protein